MSGADRRGFALAYVLVMTIVLLSAVTGLIQLTLQPAAMGAAVVNGVTDAKQAEASLARVQAAWASRDRTCASSRAHGVTCSGMGCTCSCWVTDSFAVQSRGPDDGPCSLSARAP